MGLVVYLQELFFLGKFSSEKDPLTVLGTDEDPSIHAAEKSLAHNVYYVK